MNDQLDPQAVSLAKAIRQVETGGNFQAQGKSGEYGAYQFTQPTWDKYSKDHGVNVPLNQATPEQQNEVAYKQIKSWKDQGYNVGQIASMWNSGKPDAYLDKGYKGVNKLGVTYDVPKYAESVAKAYQTLKQGGQVGADPNNPSSTSARQTFSSAIQSIQQQNPQPTDVTHSTGTSTLDKLGNGLIDIVPGAKTLGESLGTGLGAIKAKATDLLTGSKQYDNYDLSAPSPLKTAIAGGEVVGTALTAQGLGGLASTLKGGAALTSEPVKGLLTKYAGKESISALSAAEKVEAISQAIANGTGGQQAVFQKALQELAPQVLKEAGVGSFAELNPGIAKALGVGWKALELMTGLVLGNKAINTVKGLITK